MFLICLRQKFVEVESISCFYFILPRHSCMSDEKPSNSRCLKKDLNMAVKGRKEANYDRFNADSFVFKYVLSCCAATVAESGTLFCWPIKILCHAVQRCSAKSHSAARSSDETF